MSVAFIDANRHRWPVAAMCEVLGLAERSYYAAKKRSVSARAVSDEHLKIEIRRVWETNYQVYGAKQAYNAIDDLLSLPLTIYPTAPLLPRIWELRDNTTSYDACYVALAEALGCALATADQRLANAPGPRCNFVLL